MTPQPQVSFRLRPSKNSCCNLYRGLSAAFLLVACVLAIGAARSAKAQRPATSLEHANNPEVAALIQPGDLVRIRVSREPDLSGDFRVNEEGHVVIPMLGDLDVSHVSLDSLRHYAENTLRVDLRDPFIDITLLRRVKVLGAVMKPGLYEVDPTMTIGDVLALAGGATPEGVSGIVDLQQANGSKFKLTKRTRLAETPIHSGDILYIPERSWLSRNAAVVTSAGISAAAIVAATLISRR